MYFCGSAEGNFKGYKFTHDFYDESVFMTKKFCEVQGRFFEDDLSWSWEDIW